MTKTIPTTLGVLMLTIFPQIVFSDFTIEGFPERSVPDVLIDIIQFLRDVSGLFLVLIFLVLILLSILFYRNKEKRKAVFLFGRKVSFIFTIFYALLMGLFLVLYLFF